MTQITKTTRIDLGHRVPNHKSKCRNLHGHSYTIEVAVDDKVIDKKGASDEGMVIDFGDLKRIMMREIDEKHDHGFMMYQDDEYAKIFGKLKLQGQKIIFVPFIPTAENISKYWFNLLLPVLKRKKIKLEYVKIWETPTSTAKYTYAEYVKTIM